MEGSCPVACVSLFPHSCSSSPRSLHSHRARLPQAPPTVHETVVVTATGRETPESKVGASIAVVNRDEIEQRHALSTIDLLRTIPGMVAVRSGGVGNLTSVFVRGGESTYNKVLLDGMPLNEPGGAFNFASLSPENIERIEVLRGAHSALFGSDAMASVIQLFSVRPEAGRPQVHVTVDAGNFDTAHLAAGFGARQSSVDYSLFGSLLQTDNEQPNNENKTSTVSGSVNRSLASGASLRFLGRGEFGRTGTPGATAFGRADMDAYFRHRDGSVLGGWNQPIGSRVTQQTSYSYIVTKYRSTNLVTDPPYTPQFGDLVAAFPSSDFLYDSETEIERHHFEYRADGVIARNQTVTAAFAYDGERGVLTNHRSTAAPQRPERNNTGTTLQYEADRRACVARGRHQVREQRQLRLLRRAQGRRVVARQPGRGQRCRTGDHPPSRQRRARHQGTAVHSVVQPVTELPRQSGPRARAVARIRRRHRTAVCRDRAAIEATYFANHFDDLISLGPFDPVTFNAQYENIGETRASGLELAGTAILSAGFRVGGGYTLLDSKVIRSISSSPIFAPGRQLYRRPRHSGSINASYTHARVSVAVGGVFVGSRPDSDFNFPTITSNDRYATWNASGEVRIARRTAAFVTIDNLADYDYMEPLGYPGLGRAARIGIRTRF